MMEVLSEVDSLFKKLESLPDEVKTLVFKKIAEKLPDKNNKESTPSVHRRKRLGRKPGRKTEEVQGASIYSSENHDSDYIVQNVLTSRGRKAQRYCPLQAKQQTSNDESTNSDAVSTKLFSNELLKEKDQEEACSNEFSSSDKSKTCASEVESVKNEFSTKAALVKHSSEDEVIDLEDIESDVKLDSSMEEPQLVIADSVETDENEEGDAEEELSESSCAEKSILKTSPKSILKTAPVVKKEVKLRSSTGTLSCNHCAFQTSRAAILRHHIRQHRGRTYTCEECGKIFPQMSGLKVHMKRHRGQRDYPCDYGCDYRAYTKVDKARHMTIHTGERSQMCQYCGKSFAKDSTLREHVKSIHERPDRHICPTCGFCTYRANNLRVHISMKHRGEYNNHVCPVCGAKVKQRAAFLDHIRSHTGERPYRCEICDSTFTCLARLTVHCKAVHEPRQFTCKECQKSFQTKHHLLRHQYIHTNKKPFACPFCTYACNTQGNVTKHVKAVHNKPDFSYRKYKADQQIDEDCKTVKTEWIEKGEKVTEQYLKDLSKRLGKDVTLAELKEREAEKARKLNEEVEQVKIKRLNKIRKHEHSYHSHKGTPEEEDVDEPRAVLLQEPEVTHTGQPLPEARVLSEVTLDHFKNVGQTVFIQNNSDSEVGELQTVLQASESSKSQNVQFCVTESVGYEDQIPLHVIYHSQSPTDVPVENNSKFVNNINFVEMKGDAANPTVVVIINTENP